MVAKERVNMDLKRLDMAQLYGCEADRQEFARDLLEGLTDAGFVKLVNHGLSQEKVEKLFDLTKAMFGLPQERKESFENVTKPQRGWSRAGVESTATLNRVGINHAGTSINLKVANKKPGHTDHKEHFDMGPGDDPDYPNIYPNENDVPGFRSYMESYFQAYQDISLELVRALEIALKLPENMLVDRCQGAASEMRMLRYPESPLKKIREENLMPIWPHTDFGILTLLAQGSTGGLQIQDKNEPDRFISVPLLERTELLVNVGDTLERWTNGTIQAGLHRVTIPDDITGDIFPERYSVPFFLKACRTGSVGAIPYFVPAGTESKYEEMTANQYHHVRLAVSGY